MRNSFIFHVGGAYVNVDGPYQTKRVQASYHFWGEIYLHIFGRNQFFFASVIWHPFALFCIDVNKLI